MGNIKKPYAPKKANVIKLKKLLIKLENDKNK